MLTIHITAVASDHSGGAACYTKTMIAELVARGHHVSLICYQADDETRSLCTVHQIPEIVPASRIPLLWRLASAFKVASSYIALRKLHLGHADVMIASAQCLGWSYNRLLPRVPMIYVPHSLVAPVEINSYDLPRSQRLLGAHVYSHLEKSLLNKAAACIRFTKTACESLREYYGPAIRPRFEVIPQAIEVGESTPEYRDLEERPTRLLFVGRLIQSKNVPFLMESLSQLIDLDWSLDVIGGGPELANLEHLAQKYLLRDRIHFHGHQANVSTWYRRADILLLPSRLENAPLVLLEAMGESVPTLSIAADGVRYLNANHEIVTDGHDGLIAKNEQHFVELLRSAIGQREWLHQLGTRGRITVMERHTWKAHANHYESLLHRILT